MKLYAGIDLHSNNLFISIIDSKGRVVHKKRLPNDLSAILLDICPYSEEIIGIVVESTFNWYWLVDGLMQHGYSVHLANTAAIQQYQGIKHTNDESDATWLAQMLRLKLLPEGYIYPKEERPIRDLLRKRSQLVRLRTLNVLSMQTIISRNTGQSLRGDKIKVLSEAGLASILEEPEVCMAADANLSVIKTLNTEIKRIEKYVKTKAKLKPEFNNLLSVPGIGDILGLSIMLETGNINRFEKVGNYSSYCRCVNSSKLSNGKKKGENNRKNGNKFLAWAFVEAAHYAIRWEPAIKRFYQRKSSKTKAVVAIKAIAHKLSRACYYIMRDGVSFDLAKSFI